MPKPALESVPKFYQGYVKALEDKELIPLLVNHGNLTLELIKSIPEISGEYKYQPNKWSIKQVITHMIDAERIFSYRALRFARNDKTELHGFEENDYALEANADQRKLYKIIEEFANVRASTVDLFNSFTDKMMTRTGICNHQEMSVNALGYVIVGHELHHRSILNERYLSK